MSKIKLTYLDSGEKCEEIFDDLNALRADLDGSAAPEYARVVLDGLAGGGIGASVSVRNGKITDTYTIVTNDDE